MVELSPRNAAAYLGLNPAQTRITELGGGVSNTVLLVENGDRRCVLKQALGKLRVEQDWFSDRSRVLRECEGLRFFHEVAPRACPELLAVDPENFTYTMSAAPAEAHSWKELLLQGQLNEDIARQAGILLGTLIRKSLRDLKCRERFGDQTVFDQLRLDPYYRSAALRNPDLGGRIEDLIDRCRRDARCLVHGDFSPKNLLVDQDRVMVIDFEVIHYGDPGFDAAFLLNHLLLKSFHRPQDMAGFLNLASIFFTALTQHVPQASPELESGTVAHLGGLMLARIDGKSPVEYLASPVRPVVRDFARWILIEQPPLANILEARSAWQ